MIQIEHDNYKVVAVSINDVAVKFNQNSFIGDILYNLSCKYAEETIIWFHSLQKGNVNLNFIESEKHLDRLMMSYNPFGNYFPDQIGYVEDSPFIKVNKAVRYPTWQMSSVVGMMSCSIIKQTEKKMWQYKDFDFCLNTVAKNYQPLGLFCYSEPKLINKRIECEYPVADFRVLFKFTSQNYKYVWRLLLFVNLIIYEEKFKFLQFFRSIFTRNRQKCFSAIAFNEIKNKTDIFLNDTIDVIIPTIGRSSHCYNVMCDLRNQTYLPLKVIVVEQNPIDNSQTELNFIEDEQWPFEIVHIFTRQAGACNARNLALSNVNSAWVFLNDDDNRFGANLIKDALTTLKQLKLDCLITAYPQLDEINNNPFISQTTIFGSGNSFLKSDWLENVKFSASLEFGYGEDTDFGLQLRNVGVDVVFVPSLQITHLKAPMGGFRIKVDQPWSSEEIQPKPSPTIMLVKTKFSTEKQILGAKTTFFLKYFTSQKTKNPIKYIQQFKEQWQASEKWANELENR